MASFASPTSYTPSSTVTLGYGQDSLGFSVRATVLYIGLSVGILLVVLFMLGFSLIYCVRPNRRRQQTLLAIQRQRAAAIQATKDEDETFKPQIRPLPIVVLQPGGGGDLTLAQPDDGEANGSAAVPSPAGAAPETVANLAAADPDDPEKGEASCSSRHEASRSGSSAPNGSGEGGSGCTCRSASGRSLRSPGPRSEGDACITCSICGDCAEEPIQFNPLTHYLTEREARYSVVSVEL